MDKNSVLAPTHICSKHPEVCMVYSTWQWYHLAFVVVWLLRALDVDRMDPGSSIIQQNAISVILDIVKRYEVDGVHL